MHALSEPYLPVHARTVPRRQTPDRQPWDTASFPALTETGAQRRCDFIKAQIPDPETASDDDLREAMAGAMASVSALPVFGEKPVADVLAAQEQEARYVA